MTQAKVLRRIKADLKRLHQVNELLKKPEFNTEELKAKRDRLIKDINRISKLYGKPRSI